MEKLSAISANLRELHWKVEYLREELKSGDGIKMLEGQKNEINNLLRESMFNISECYEKMLQIEKQIQRKNPHPAIHNKRSKRRRENAN